MKLYDITSRRIRVHVFADFIVACVVAHCTDALYFDFGGRHRTMAMTAQTINPMEKRAAAMSPIKCQSVRASAQSYCSERLGDFFKHHPNSNLLSTTALGREKLKKEICPRKS